MMTGSAIAIPWEDKNVPAIVNAWYGGQSAGTAIADVLFGDYNPAGRLPVTFYASDKDIPGFSDYTMNGRTYRYFKGKALYPFGYGLSYTSFKYADLKLPASIASGKEVPVTVTLTNTGSRDGEEVIQLYVAHQGVKGKAPIRALKGFKRVFLKAGETASFDFKLKADDLSLVKEADGSRYIPSGKVQVSVGGGQPGERTGSGNVVSGIVSIQ